MRKCQRAKQKMLSILDSKVFRHRQNISKGSLDRFLLNVIKKKTRSSKTHGLQITVILGNRREGNKKDPLYK